MFATPLDLLARSNARRLGQLAVPGDMAMPPEDGLRIAINGGDLSGFSSADQTALGLAMGAINDALSDANQLMLAHDIPASASSTLLARLCSTIALYYLQGAERMTDDTRLAYKGVMDTLKAAKEGKLALVPAPAPATPPTHANVPGDDDYLVGFVSEPRRYRGFNPDTSDDFFNAGD